MSLYSIIGVKSSIWFGNCKLVKLFVSLSTLILFILGLEFILSSFNLFKFFKGDISEILFDDKFSLSKLTNGFINSIELTLEENKFKTLSELSSDKGEKSIGFSVCIKNDASNSSKFLKYLKSSRLKSPHSDCTKFIFF